MSDLIERKKAIDAIEFGITYAKAINKETGEVKELFQASNDELRKAEDRIKQLPSAQPEIIRCKECKHFEYNHPYIIQGIPVLEHEVCNAWGDGCKADENGYCFLAERRVDG